MSQEKVDRYKEQKKNRKKIMKQEKCKRYLGYTATVVVIALIIGWASPFIKIMKQINRYPIQR